MYDLQFLIESSPPQKCKNMTSLVYVCHLIEERKKSRFSPSLDISFKRSSLP